MACYRANFTFRRAVLRKAIIGYVMSVRLSVRMEQFDPRWTNFHEIWYLRIFRKSFEKIQFWLKYDKNSEHFTCRRALLRLLYRWILTGMRNVVDEMCGKNQHTHSVFFFPPRYSCHFWDNGEKYGRTGQATGGSIIGRRKYAICMPDN
jgi:hypothetical protein